MRKVLSRAAYPAAVLALFSLDRLTKSWAIHSLQPHGEIPLLPFFSLTYVENTGIAFGMFRGRNSPLVLLSVFLILGLLWWRRRIPGTARLAHWAVILVVAGAVGNLYDRIVYGCVVDFLDFKVWPVFNVADSCITVGACLLALSLLRAPSNP